MLSDGIVGIPAAMADGSRIPLRLGRTRELVMTDTRGRYASATHRGYTFSAMTAIAGTTVVTANNTPVGAAAASLLTIYNPMGSGINAELLKTWLFMISGTPGVGAFVYNVGFNQSITATPNNAGTSGAVPESGSSMLTGKVKAYTQTNLTGSTAQLLLRPISAPFAAAIAATSVGINVVDWVDGDIVVPPGGIVSIASTAIGTSNVIAAGMEWMEIPSS